MLSVKTHKPGIASLPFLLHRTVPSERNFHNVIMVVTESFSVISRMAGNIATSVKVFQQYTGINSVNFGKDQANGVD